ncbi:MAG: transposase, partial [Candidatus Aminicenantes bacterium]|nr:transposase [Candidatus Aminicenantes bacterium]
RRTYEGAFHHAMNRGYEGKPIFRSAADKKFFLALLGRIQPLTKIRILAYCVLDNHYHLVIQNVSGRMSDFFKQLNGQYAVYYRKRHGGRGYVFQDRFKSMLIQDDAYLMIAIAYVLGNPVAAKVVASFIEYPWFSAQLYFGQDRCNAVDCGYVEELFVSRDELHRFVMDTDLDELPTVRSELGQIIGGEEFVPKALALADRRSGRESIERRRVRDKHFESPEKVLQEFEKEHSIKIAGLNIQAYSGKRMRAELLVHLKERAGMTYREIVKLDPFAGLELNSLGCLYRRARLKFPLWGE